MKKSLLLAASLAALPVTPSFANLLKNADFEAGEGDKETCAFYETPGWYNPADAGSKKAMGAPARTRVGGKEGSIYSATINDRQKEVSYFMQKTEHSIAEGEVFELAFDWTAGWQWQPQDILRVVIFAKSNNTLGGETLWEDTVDFERAPDGSWETKKHSFKPAPYEALGKTLYFSFYGVDPMEAGTAGFARVDNIELTVKPK